MTNVLIVKNGPKITAVYAPQDLVIRVQDYDITGTPTDQLAADQAQQDCYINEYIGRGLKRPALRVLKTGMNPYLTPL